MHTPPPRSHRKILVPPSLGVAVKNGYPQLFRVAGANRAKGALRAVGELRERDILLSSVSFFVCVKKGNPRPIGVSLKFWYPPPLGNLVRNG